MGILCGIFIVIFVFLLLINYISVFMKFGYELYETKKELLLDLIPFYHTINEISIIFKNLK